MKCTLVFFLCALEPVLLAQPAPNLANAAPPAVPPGPVIEVTEGYGSAKWGMSVADFEKVYPEATLDSDLPENVTNQQSGQKLYSLGNDSLRLGFTFLRGQLVKIVLHTPPPFSPYQTLGAPRNLTSMERRIEERFVARKDSGVSVRVQMTRANYMLPAGPVAQRRVGANANRSLPPPSVQGPNAAPIPIQATVSPAVPGAPQQPQPAPLQQPQPIMEISLYQSKLAEFLEENFTKEIAAAQNKAVEAFIAKLAPPK